MFIKDCLKNRDFVPFKGRYTSRSIGIGPRSAAPPGFDEEEEFVTVEQLPQWPVRHLPHPVQCLKRHGMVDKETGESGRYGAACVPGTKEAPLEPSIPDVGDRRGPDNGLCVVADEAGRYRGDATCEALSICFDTEVRHGIVRATHL